MSKIEIVFIPARGMGHFLTAVEFAKLIVKNNPNISIIFLLYRFSISEPAKKNKSNAFIDSQLSEVNPDQITFITLPPPSNPPDPSSPDYFRSGIEIQIPIVKRAVEDRHVKPAAFIIDLMNVPMIDVANELEVPAYIYFISGANFLYTMFHMEALANKNGIDNVTRLMDDPNAELELPIFGNPMPTKIVPWAFFEKDMGWPSFIIDRARWFKKAKGILVNTFKEFESPALHALQELDNVPTIYPVGPILSLNERGDLKPSHNNDLSCKNDEDDIVRWLDGQPKSSVVFLCFGSMGCFDAEQIKEIANGLDRSGYRFLWSLRKMVRVGWVAARPSEDEIFEEALPKGFLDRTAHRGKIISWAPQAIVLAHQAVGGFVSHCGWNSVLESMWFGVPIATWPLYAEQQLIAFSIVKELGLAVEISLDYRWEFKKEKGNYLVLADEVEIGIRKLMSMEKEMKRTLSEMSDKSNKDLLLSVDGKMRKNVKQMSEDGKKALEVGGSSYNSLRRFIEDLLSNTNK